MPASLISGRHTGNLCGRAWKRTQGWSCSKMFTCNCDGRVFHISSGILIRFFFFLFACSWGPSRLLLAINKLLVIRSGRAQSDVLASPAQIAQGLWWLGLCQTHSLFSCLHLHFRAFIRVFCPKRLTVTHTYIHTLMAVAAMQGADQHVRSSLGLSILGKNTWTCRPRPGESNQRPAGNKMSALPPIYFSCLGESCNALSMWSSRNVLWATKRPLTFHLHEAESMMTEFGWAVPLASTYQKKMTRV